MTPSNDEAVDHEALFADIEQALGQVPDDKLEMLTALVDQIDARTAEQAHLKLELERVGGDLRRLQQNLVPELMIDVLGLSNIGLKDGRQVEIAPFVSAHITEENKPEALQWLRDHGYDGIIKKILTVVLGKTSDKKVQKLVAMIIAAGYADVTVGETVHGQTLKKWARETLEKEAETIRDGGTVEDPVPLELFGIFNGRTTKIK